MIIVGYLERKCQAGTLTFGFRSRVVLKGGGGALCGVRVLEAPVEVRPSDRANRKPNPNPNPNPIHIPNPNPDTNPNPNSNSNSNPNSNPNTNSNSNPNPNPNPNRYSRALFGAKTLEALVTFRAWDRARVRVRAEV